MEGRDALVRATVRRHPHHFSRNHVRVPDEPLGKVSLFPDEQFMLGEDQFHSTPSLDVLHLDVRVAEGEEVHAVVHVAELRHCHRAAFGDCHLRFGHLLGLFELLLLSLRTGFQAGTLDTVESCFLFGEPPLLGFLANPLEFGLLGLFLGESLFFRHLVQVVAEHLLGFPFEALEVRHEVRTRPHDAEDGQIDVRFPLHTGQLVTTLGVVERNHRHGHLGRVLRLHHPHTEVSRGLVAAREGVLTDVAGDEVVDVVVATLVQPTEKFPAGFLRRALPFRQLGFLSLPFATGIGPFDHLRHVVAGAFSFPAFLAHGSPFTKNDSLWNKG